MKPSEREEEYMARMEFERKKRLKEEVGRQISEEEKKRLKDLHYMKCPKCGMDLIEIDYQKVKVDKCSHCDGLWFDAGEMEEAAAMEKSTLDKLFSVFKR